MKKRLAQMLFLLFICSALVYAYEKTLYSRDFLYSGSNFKSELSESLMSFNEQRDVASSKKVKSQMSPSDHPLVQYIPVNIASVSKFKGEWRIMRVTNHKKETIYDAYKFQKDKNKKMIVELNLVGTSLVRAEYFDKIGKEVFHFDVSYLDPKAKAVVLFRSFKDGYEIIEASKLMKLKKASTLPSKVARVQRKPRLVENTIKTKFIRPAHVNQELILDKASYPKVSNGLLPKESISGTVVFGNDSIEVLDVQLSFPGGQEVSFQLDFTNINHVGHFSYNENEKKSSGLVTKNGENSYRVRIVNGTHAGAMFSFSTYDEILKQEEEKYQRELSSQQEDYKNDADDKELQDRDPSSVRSAPKGFSFSARPLKL